MNIKTSYADKIMDFLCSSELRDFYYLDRYFTLSSKCVILQFLICNFAPLLMLMMMDLSKFYNNAGKCLLGCQF